MYDAEAPGSIPTTVWDHLFPPDPPAVGSGAGGAVTATSFAAIPSGTGVVSITNPSTVAALLVDVRFGAWLTCTTQSDYIRASVANNGGDVAVTGTPGGGGLTSWGQILHHATAAGTIVAVTTKQHSSFTIQVPAGDTLSLQMVAMRNDASASVAAYYPFLELLPLRYV